MRFHESYNVEDGEKFSSKIELKFFRHDDKESRDTTRERLNEDGDVDAHVRLTEGGRMHAKEEAEIESISQAVAFGSGRDRTQETALYHMAGKLPEITGLESLEELKSKVGASKLVIDSRLAFTLEGGNEYSTEATKALRENRLMKFMVEESDALAAQVGDVESSTYSRQAAQIATLVEKYIQIAPRFDKLAHDEEKEYENVMYRFMGTHQGVGECFLSKIIEKTKGVSERDRFVEVIEHGGFDFSEGFKVDITTPSGGTSPTVRISYAKDIGNEDVFEFDEEVPLETITQIACGN